jgi:hypothetical protein
MAFRVVQPAELELIHIEPGTALQAVDHGGDALVVVCACGYPPESANAELLDDAV